MEAKKIEAIKNYLSFYDAKYYDIQAELIDHFATAIEKYQKENPELTFKEAFMKVDSDFGGRKGVWNYISSVEQIVSKRTFSMLGHLMIDFFSWPQVLVVSSIFLFWHFTLQQVTSDLGFIFSILAGLGLLVVWTVNKQRLKEVPLYMPRHANRVAIRIYGSLLGATYWYYSIINTTDHWVAICCFSLLSIILISMLQLPKLAIKETLKKYPQLA